jgi:hypothetical protein
MSSWRVQVGTGWSGKKPGRPPTLNAGTTPFVMAWRYVRKGVSLSKADRLHHLVTEWLSSIATYHLSPDYYR